MIPRFVRRLGRLAAPLLAALLLAVPALAEEPVPLNARRDLFDARYVVAADQTYTETITSEITLLTPRGIAQHDRVSVTFYPKSQKLEVLEAWVVQPDGTRVEVGPEGRFTRPSAASQNAPGFTGSLTTTVVFPRLQPGSRTHIVWRRTQTTPPTLGFAAWSIASLEDASVIDRLSIEAPADLPLHWGARGGVLTTDTTEGALQHITAEMPPQPGARPEPAAVNPTDFQPLFVASTQPSVAAIGARYAALSAGRAEPTAEVSALAARIVGPRTGEDAARALYDWVSTNIRYVALTLNIEDGWVPHAADEVLRAGYGDCKDHVALLGALLKSRGIDSVPALIDWGGRTRPLPWAHPGEFDHVILYLPAYDRWLNPTNPYAPYGTLDTGLVGKQVALATPAGAEGHTPPATPADNRYARVATLTLAADGTLSGQASWSLSPNIDAVFRSLLARSSSSQQLLENLLTPTPEGGFGSFTFSDPRDLGRPLEVSAVWHSPHGVTPPAPETTLTVPSAPDIETVRMLRRYLMPDGRRRTPMLIGARDLSWSTTLDLPAGTTAGRLPADVAFSNDAGAYTAHARRTETGVRVDRRLVIAHDVTQPEAYPALEALLYAALDDARATLTLAH